MNEGNVSATDIEQSAVAELQPYWTRQRDDDSLKVKVSVNIRKEKEDLSDRH